MAQEHNRAIAVRKISIPPSAKRYDQFEMTAHNQSPPSNLTVWHIASHALSLVWRYKVLLIGAVGASLYVAFIALGFERVMFFDEQEYLRIANNLIKSGIYGYEPGIPTASRPPGYLMFILPIVGLGFAKPGIVFAQLFLWGAAVYLTGIISCNLRGPRAGALAILFATLYPLCGFVSLTVYPQILTAVLVLLFVWALLKQKNAFPDAKLSILAGTIAGITILVSPILLP